MNRQFIIKLASTMMIGLQVKRTTVNRGWTEIENIGESLKNVCNYLCFLKKNDSESRSPDRPHVAVPDPMESY